MSTILLQTAKLALRVATAAFDEEITALIEAGKQDLTIAGISPVDETDPLVKQAVITYVRLHFGQPDDFDRLKASFDEQKAQLQTSTWYTVWEGA